MWLSCFSCEISSRWLTHHVPVSCRHKRVWGHQRQGALVWERTVHQHGGILQVHLFARLRGLRQATQVHPGDPGVRAQWDWKLRQWLFSAGSSCSLKDHLTPLCPSHKGPGTKPPTVTLKRPILFPYTPHTIIQKHTYLYSAQNTPVSPHTHTRGPGINAVNELHGI